MRAYLAVLKDSLREAMASRVLWVALIAIAVVLLALAPFALRTDSATELRRRELVDAERLVRNLDENKNRGDTPGGHIWSLLSSDQKAALAQLLEEPESIGTNPRRGPARRGTPRVVVNSLNELLKRDGFYNEDSWAAVELSEDLKSLLENTSPSENELANRNLQLLVAAFPRAIRVQDSTEMSLTYAGNTVAGPLPLTQSQLKPVVDRALVFVVSGFLGFLGVFASLLVTASIIPRTFEPGEIALLLSKPVNRAFLFLTKFFGGCIFTLVCATALVGGVWLLLGVRMGIWEHNLLLCIPLYVFLFAVYYAVSATAGLVWRNAIVGLVLVVVFWLVLFIVGVVKAALDENVFKPSAITEIIPGDDAMFGVNGSRQLLTYNAATRQWDEKFKRETGNMPAMVQRILFAGTRFRPTLDAKNKRLLTIEQSPSRFGGVGRGKLVIGYEDSNYEREQEGETPGAATAVFVDSTGRIVIPCRTGVFEFVGQSDQDRKTQEFFDNILGGLMSTSNKKAFKAIHGEVPTWSSDFQVIMHADDTLFVYSDGAITRVNKAEDGTYSAGIQRDLETEEDAVFSVGGSALTIALADGSIRVLDTTTLEDVFVDQLEDGVLPRVSTTAPDGSVSAVLTHSGVVWLFDSKISKLHDWRPIENGDVSGLAFDDNGHIYVAAGRQTIKKYAVGSNQAVEELAVDGDWVTRLYDWVISPIYTILPKPGEVDNFVYYLLTGSKSQSVVNSLAVQANLEEDRVVFDIWRPIWSNLAFIAVLLAFGCFYVSRKDF